MAFAVPSDQIRYLAPAVAVPVHVRCESVIASSPQGVTDFSVVLIGNYVSCAGHMMGFVGDGATMRHSMFSQEVFDKHHFRFRSRQPLRRRAVIPPAYAGGFLRPAKAGRLAVWLASRRRAALTWGKQCPTCHGHSLVYRSCHSVSVGDT